MSVTKIFLCVLCKCGIFWKIEKRENELENKLKRLSNETASLLIRVEFHVK